MSDQVKTEQPTEKHLQEATEEGNFARTPDLQVVFILVAAFFVIGFGQRDYAERIAGMSVGIFAHLGKYSINPEAIGEWNSVAVQAMLGLILPIAVTCALAAALAGGLQSRFQMTPKAIDFKWSRLDPVSGFARIFSAQGFVKLGTDALKLAVVGLSLWSAVQAAMSDPIFYTPVAVGRLGADGASTRRDWSPRFINSMPLPEAKAIQFPSAVMLGLISSVVLIVRRVRAVIAGRRARHAALTLPQNNS